MSWSVSAVGKASAVATRIKEQMAVGKCAEPEETIKQAVGEIIATALGSMPEQSLAVKVEASGSQSTTNNIVVSNSLTVKIEPIHGFLD